MTDQENETLPIHLCLGLLYVASYDSQKAMTPLTKAISILGQSKSENLFVAHLLLADIYKEQRQYKEAIAHFDYALESIKTFESQKDRVLQTEVILSRIDCLIHINEKDVAIVKLERLARSFTSNDTDTKRISLKVIVCDSLSQYCLTENKYELFDTITEESMALKVRNFSQYHPSLAITLILIARHHVSQSRYHQALDFYEHALEVQALNFTDHHPKIRTICYAIGDIYCKLDKISNAMEKYDVAENRNVDEDEEFMFQEEPINIEESMNILLCRINMHRHLAEYHAKKQLYQEAISQMDEIIVLLKQELPTSVFEKNDDTFFIAKNIDATIFIIKLQQLADCYSHLDDLLGCDQDDHDGYEAALEIYSKLFQYDRNLAENKLFLLNQKLSKYYEDFEENDEALQFLQKSAEFQPTTPTIATLYRLGSLNSTCDQFDQALENYKTILLHESTQNKHLKEIVQKKIDQAQKKIDEQQKDQSSSANESEEDTNEHSRLNSANRLSRSPTNVSTGSRQGNEEDSHTKSANAGQFHSVSIVNTLESNKPVEKNLVVDSSDYRAVALAYYQLSDFDMSKEFYERDTKKHSKDLTIFKTQLDTIEQGAYIYEQQCISMVLPMFLRSLITSIKAKNSFEDSNILDTADSFFQCALLYTQSSSDIDTIVAYVSSLSLYISKSTNDVNQLMIDVNNLLDLFTDCNLQPEDVIQVSSRLLSADDQNKIRLKIASMFRDDEMDNVKDLDGDDDTSNESRMIALQWYKDLLGNTNDVLVKSVCFYNILTLYKDFIYEDDKGKSIVDQLINYLPLFTLSDRHLLIALALDFLKEYNNNFQQCDIKLHRQLKKLAKDASEENIQLNEDKNIGNYLYQSNDIQGAAKYWSSISEQLKSDIPNQLLTIARSSHSTFDQILHAINQSKTDTMMLLHHLIDTYEIMADYYMLEGRNNTTNPAISYQQAENAYQDALHLLRQLKDNDNDKKINDLERKQKEAKIQAKK